MVKYDIPMSGITLKGKFYTIPQLIDAGHKVVYLVVLNGYQYFLADGTYLGMDTDLFEGAERAD